MKKLILISYLILTVTTINAQEKELPKLSGPYLGLKPPGTTPEIFAPGIVSQSGVQSKLLISQDGSEIIFKNMISNGNSPSERKSSFISIKMKSDVWGLPIDIPFSMQYMNDEPAISPDGQKLFFVSNRPEKANGEPLKMPNIWMSSKTNDGWGEPQNLGSPVNSDDVEAQPFYSTDHKLYFGRRDGIYYSQYSNERFDQPVKLNEEIFKERVRGVCISPDNKIMIVHSDRAGGFGSWDLYITFKSEDGIWGELINMGNSINTEQPDANATFSPDGKYLFFSRGDDIYWVSAKIIEELRQKK